MTARRGRIAGIAGACLTAGIALAGFAGPADALDTPDWVITKANTLGPLAIEPVKGDLVAPMEVTSSGSCPRGTHSITRIFGPKLPEHGVNVVGNSAIYLLGTPPGDTMHAAFGITLQDLAQSQQPPVKLAGTYRLVMNCQIKILTDASEAYNFYVGEIRINGNEYTSLTTLKDLPKIPVATPGAEAIAYQQDSLQGPTESPAPENVSAVSDSGSNSTATAVIATVAVLVVGLGGFGIVTMRSRGRTNAGSRS